MRLTVRSATAAGISILLAACQSPARSATMTQAIGEIERIDAALDAIIPRDARIEKLSDGHDWLEGPVWRRSGGYLLFSDIPKNTIYRWKEGEGLGVFLRPAGHSGSTPPGRELGTNGLTFDSSDRLVMADHGNRQISRLNETNFTRVALADRYSGKRLNSPNDLVHHSNGDLYFTDPPYGLDGANRSPAKELPFSGVYRLRPNGELSLLTEEHTYPNGIAFSPDERTLYVAVSDPQRAIWMAYDVAADGTTTNGRIFFDATPLARQGKKGLPDGMKVDQRGNLFATGPGGVLVFSPQGKHLGTIATGQATANCAFGDDGSTLYITADMMLLRVRLTTKGAGF
jgi:gluconolactonase